jgi:hypothetical protein
VSRAAALALAAVAVAGCHDGHGLVTVTVATTGGTLSNVNHLAVRVTDQTRIPPRTSTPITVAVPAHAIPPALTVALLFDHQVDGPVDLAVDAVLDDGSTITASTPTRVSTYHEVTASVYLPAPVLPVDMALPPDMADPCAGVMPANVRKYVVNRVLAPLQRLDYSIDLNGDGRQDNQLGNVCGAMQGQNYGVQAAMDAEVNAGQDILLLSVASADPGFSTGACTLTRLFNGKNQANPDFTSGMGAFTVDSNVPEARFTGPLVSGAYQSAPLPPAAITPVKLMLKLPLSGTTAVPLTAGHISYTIAGNGLMSGQIQGAMSVADENTYLIPGMQAQLQQRASENPCSPTCVQVRNIFDNGGRGDPACTSNTCKNPDGTCAVAKDNVISFCEVSTSGLIVNVLAPDVQLTDGIGHYQPNPQNANKDSLSVAIGFTAVPALF